ncbi:hypothetical protein BC937DRAFT_94882 [Endogone sp. FLAS-F59071]|nr:hypothetical protein BC937DRAFT_94882 [Endogone sp. FLAS-F59071]|eukprot:RUS13718.1 hypothetical protein BC937DRAFT_94882 [Endogone sp. FLAS-F59071]
MRFFTVLLVVAIIASAALAAPAKNQKVAKTTTHCSSWYKVKADDTCWAISLKAKISLPTFMSYNSKLNCSLLQLGEQVCIAIAPGPTPTSLAPTKKPTSSWGCTKLHTVTDQDTCWSISQAAKLSLDTFMSYNPLLNCNFLDAGVSVCIAEGPGGVAPPPIPIYSCSESGYFAITFDDGPYKYTSALIDFLVKNNLKVTFFINGQNFGNIYDYAAPLKKAYDAGMQIAHHTWSHAVNIHSCLLSGIINDFSLDILIYRISRLLTSLSFVSKLPSWKRLLGKFSVSFRPPYGAYTPDNLRIIGEMGYKVIVWDVDSEDWLVENFAKEQANYKSALKGTSPKNSGHISLQHDPHPISAQQLAPWAVKYVHSLGYKITTVADCLGDHNPKDWYRP